MECEFNADCSTNNCTGGECYPCSADNPYHGDYDCNQNDEQEGADSKTCVDNKCVFTYSECTDSDGCASGLCTAGKCYTCQTDPVNSIFACSENATCIEGVCISEDDGLSGGAIAGIIIGSVVGVALIVFAVCYCMKKGGETDGSKAVAYN